MSFEEFKRDLETYKINEILTIAKYYGIETEGISLPNLIEQIAGRNYQRGEMISGCDNETEYITMDRWSKDLQPDLSVTFVDPEGGRPRTECYLSEYITPTIQEYRGWYVNRHNQRVGVSMSESGVGGSPSNSEKFYQVMGMYFFTNPVEQLRDIQGEYTAYPLYLNKRIGNIEGSFGEGRLHGQEPGYIVYYLATGDVSTHREQLADEVQRINEIKLSSTTLDDSMDIKELLNELRRHRDVIPIRDIVAENVRIVDPALERALEIFEDQSECALLIVGKNQGEYTDAIIYCNAEDAIEDLEIYGADEYKEIILTHDINPDWEEYDKPFESPEEFPETLKNIIRENPRVSEELMGWWREEFD
jgi:hypothetical protein